MFHFCRFIIYNPNVICFYTRFILDGVIEFVMYIVRFPAGKTKRLLVYFFLLDFFGLKLIRF